MPRGWLPSSTPSLRLHAGRKLLSDNKWESAVAPALEDAKEWAEEAGETLQETFGKSGHVESRIQTSSLRS